MVYGDNKTNDKQNIAQLVRTSIQRAKDKSKKFIIFPTNCDEKYYQVLQDVFDKHENWNIGYTGIHEISPGELKGVPVGYWVTNEDEEMEPKRMKRSDVEEAYRRVVGKWKIPVAWMKRVTTEIKTSNNLI